MPIIYRSTKGSNLDADEVDANFQTLVNADTTLQTNIDLKQDELGFTPVPDTRTVNGNALTSDITLDKSDLGLSNVDNTSDANKPVSTAQAVADALVLSTAEAYTDALVVGLWDDRGNYNASVNTFPASGGSGSAGAVKKGDIWTVSVAGTLGGHAVTAGDTVRALQDTPGQTDSNWAIAENNIGYVAENSANKDASGGYAGLTLFKINFKNALNTFTSFFTNSNTAARTYTYQDRNGIIADDTDLALKENVANKDTDGTLTANSDTKYPSQKAVKTYVDAHASSSSFAGLTGVYSDNTSLNNKIVAMDAATAAKQTAFTNKNANLVYSGPGSGSAASPTFRALVNADLPTGVPTLLPTTVGRIITEPFNNITAWSSLGGGTFSAAAGVLTCTGGTPASITLTKYLRASTYGTTNYQQWTTVTNITVGTINATSWGIALGVKATSAVPSLDFQFGIMLDSTNKGNIFLFTNLSNTIIKQTSNPIAVSAGDVLTVTVQRYYNQVLCKVYNTTQGGVIYLSANQNDFNSAVTAQACQFSIHEMGGTHTITGGYTVDCDQKVGADYLFIGDSRIVSLGHENNSFVQMLQNQIVGFCDIYAGSGNYIQDLTAAEIVTLAPRKIIFLGGTNNVPAGDSAAVAVGRVQTLFAALTGYSLAGGNLFYMDEFPRTGTDLTAYSALLKSTLGTTGCIFTFQSLLATGATTPITTLFDSDLVHPNYAGNMVIANILMNSLSVTRSNKPNPHASIPYFLNGGLLLGNTFTGNIPSNALLIVDRSCMSQIRFAGTSTGAGGALWAQAATNVAWFLAGCHGIDGSNIQADATSGSMYGQSAAVHYFATFSGGTVGNNVAPVYRANISATGLKVGDNGAATAQVHIKAGTATASTAPLKFTSGTNLTTAEAGAFEYNGTNLFFTRSGTTRENVICTSAVNSVSPTSPNRTLTVVIDGTTYYISAKTTND